MSEIDPQKPDARSQREQEEVAREHDMAIKRQLQNQDAAAHANNLKEVEAREALRRAPRVP